MEKLYDKIIWHNGTSPALDEDNLNEMSDALDGIDDRVISIAGDVLVTVPQLQEMLTSAQALIDGLETLSKNPPYIGANGNWYVFNTDTMQYEDSGVDASITVTIADVTAIAPDATPYVTNTGTNTDPVFHLYIPRGATGAAGADGVSPEVTITSITGGHRVTITDADHPSGQSFDVMDGAGAGDMKASVYDPTSAVANAGGIPAYLTANQVKSDWNASSGAAEILNKPTLGTAAALDSASTVTSGGTGLPTSGAVYTAIEPVKGVFTSAVSAAIGATSATITDAAIKTTSIVDDYCETASGKKVPVKQIVITTGQAVLSFDALTEAASFKLWIR